MLLTLRLDHNGWPDIRQAMRQSRRSYLESDRHKVSLKGVKI